MGLKKKQTTQDIVNQAVDKSTQAVAVFTNTIEDLRQANELLESARNKDVEQIVELEERVENVDKQRALNSNLINRITAIIGG